MSRAQKRLLAGAIVFAMAAVAVYVIQTGRQAPALPLADGDPVKGAQLYAENCASCHGAELEGQADWQTTNEDGTLRAPPHDETGHTWHHGDALLFSYTKLGGQLAMQRMGVEGFISAMPGFAEVLSDDEIRDIMAFIKSTWPDRVRLMQASRTEAERMKGN